MNFLNTLSTLISKSLILILCYHVYFKLSTRKTAQALVEIHGIKISHTMVANSALAAAAVIKPFVGTFNYKPSTILSADVIKLWLFSYYQYWLNIK